MSKKSSLYELKRKLKSARSMQYRILATIIFAMLAITIFIGGISLYEVDQYIQNETEKYVVVTCENKATQIDAFFGDMEKSVKVMESYVMDFFTEDVVVEDREFQGKVISSASRMFADVAKHTSGAIAYYFRLDPAISDGKAGLFYSRTERSEEYVCYEPTDILLYDKDDVEHVGWFWQPYQEGKAVWMLPYHNQNINTKMVSYVVPMYYKEVFVGVVGMDFDYAFLAERVHEVEVYENGFAHLEIDGEVVCVDDHVFEDGSNHDKDKYLSVSKALKKGMSLVVSANYDDIRQIRYEICLKILWVVLILSAVFTVLTIMVVRKIVSPLKKITDAATKLSNGDYNVEFVRSNVSEIELLNTAFANMALNLHEREKELHFSANRDSLTGLRNTTSYKSWVVDFEKEVENKTADFGVAVFDLNNLKKINDTYGHDLGNVFIVAAARVISDIFKRSPVFRIGGDEFVAVLLGKDLEICEELFEKFDLECAKTFIDEKNTISISVARGFAKFDRNQDLLFKDVFKRADNAMYENKRKSRDI